MFGRCPIWMSWGAKTSMKGRRHPALCVCARVRALRVCCFALLLRVGSVTTSRNTRRHPALSVCAACVELNARFDILLCCCGSRRKKRSPTSSVFRQHCVLSCERLDIYVFSFMASRGLDVRSRVGCIQVKFLQLLKCIKLKNADFKSVNFRCIDFQ